MSKRSVSKRSASKRSVRRSAKLSVRRSSKGSLAIAIGGSITAAAVIVGVVSAWWRFAGDPNRVSVAERLLDFGAPGHLLGTDALGRDVVAGLLSGIHTSLVVGVASSLFGLVVGCGVGLLAAAGPSWIDEALMRGADVLLAIPGLIFALVLAATMGSGILPTVIALAMFFTPSFARVIRAAALRVLTEDFVQSARLYGRRSPYIVVRHVIPNIASVLMVQFTLFFALGILIEAGLSYLGVGVQRPQISLGLLLKEAQDQVGITGMLAFWPGATIAVIVLGLNLLGDGLRDRFDPKTGSTR
jgi:peptide/nickel transport system permease protein